MNKQYLVAFLFEHVFAAFNTDIKGITTNNWTRPIIFLIYRRVFL